MGYNTEFVGSFKLNDTIDEETKRELKNLELKHDDYIETKKPGVWCQWKYNETENLIEFDGGEKFYDYIEWLLYIINKIITPSHCMLNGKMVFSGDDYDDLGIIWVKSNIVVIENITMEKVYTILLNDYSHN